MRINYRFIYLFYLSYTLYSRISQTYGVGKQSAVPGENHDMLMEDFTTYAQRGSQPVVNVQCKENYSIFAEMLL